MHFITLSHSLSLYRLVFLLRSNDQFLLRPKRDRPGRTFRQNSAKRRVSNMMDTTAVLCPPLTSPFCNSGENPLLKPLHPQHNGKRPASYPSHTFHPAVRLNLFTRSYLPDAFAIPCNHGPMPITTP